MRYSAGEFTLPATDAALGVDEHSLHAGHGELVRFSWWVAILW
jgi:hypothetical protein